MRHVHLGAATLGDRRHMRECGDAGETGEHRDGDVDLVLGRDRVGLGVEGVEQQHGALKHVHDARRHRGHGELFDVLVAQMPKGAQTFAKAVEFLLVGQRTRDEQVGDLFVAITILGLGAVDQVLDAIAAQRELALVGHDLAVDLVVAVHVRDAGKARDHARAVGIAQTALDVMLDKQALVIRIGRQAVVEVFAFGRKLAARFVVQNQAAQVIVKAVIDFLGVVSHARSSRGRVEAACLGADAPACSRTACSLQAVHKVKDVLALDGHVDARKLAGLGQRLLQLGEVELGLGGVGQHGHGEDVLDNGLRNVADVDVGLAQNTGDAGDDAGAVLAKDGDDDTGGRDLGHGKPFRVVAARAGRSATVQCPSLYLSGAKRGVLTAALHACNMSVRGKAVRGRAVWRVSGSCWVDFRSQPNTLSGQAVPAVSRTPPTADSELEAEGIPALR